MDIWYFFQSSVSIWRYFFTVLFSAPEYSAKAWTSVKYTLGLSFPNVSSDPLNKIFRFAT